MHMCGTGAHACVGQPWVSGAEVDKTRFVCVRKLWRECRPSASSSLCSLVLCIELGVVEAFHFEAPRKLEPVSWERFHGVRLALCSMVENWMVVGTRQCCHVATHA